MAGSRLRTATAQHGSACQGPNAVLPISNMVTASRGPGRLSHEAAAFGTDHGGRNNNRRTTMSRFLLAGLVLTAAAQGAQASETASSRSSIDAMVSSHAK